MRNQCLFILALCALGSASIAAADVKVVSVELENMTISLPAVDTGKLPVVFLAHNGGAVKEDWGDYPAELAAKGYVVVNIGWTVFIGSDDLELSMGKALAAYASRIDTSRAAFIGGCHGGIKMSTAMRHSLPVTLKAIAFLSMSENNPPPETHPPVLGIYSLKDHLGGGYVRTQKRVYNILITEPKKVIALDATPHGNELVTDATTKDAVRAEINAWIAGLI